MSFKLFIFPTPLDSAVGARHDADGIIREAVDDTHPTGRKGKSITFPDNIPNANGCGLEIHADKKVPVKVRGILYLKDNGMAELNVDDFTLTDEKVCPDPPVPPIPPLPPTGDTPFDIIKNVYNTGDFDLSTKEGCGQFTEACCERLHIIDSDKWGHIKKTGAQNNYNGHAVDAIMLKIPTAETQQGIYDIIVSSEGDSAEPAFNRQGDANLSLWYYPA